MIITGPGYINITVSEEDIQLHSTKYHAIQAVPIDDEDSP